MNQNRSPSQWLAPSWHADFGDSTAEFEHLRMLGVALEACVPCPRIDLIDSEPGLMNLEIRLEDGVAEVYSNVDAGMRHYAIYQHVGTQEETERHATSLEEAMAAFGTVPSLAPGERLAFKQGGPAFAARGLGAPLGQPRS